MPFSLGETIWPNICHAIRIPRTQLLKGVRNCRITAVPDAIVCSLTAISCSHPTVPVHLQMTDLTPEANPGPPPRYARDASAARDDSAGRRRSEERRVGKEWRAWLVM